MSVVPARDQIDIMVSALRYMKGGKRIEQFTDYDEARALLVAFNFIQRREVEKPCPTCGKPKHDYGYFKITPAGEAILWLADNPREIA